MLRDNRRTVSWYLQLPNGSDRNRLCGEMDTKTGKRIRFSWCDFSSLVCLLPFLYSVFFNKETKRIAWDPVVAVFSAQAVRVTESDAFPTQRSLESRSSQQCMENRDHAVLEQLSSHLRTLPLFSELMQSIQLTGKGICGSLCRSVLSFGTSRLFQPPVSCISAT